MYIHTSWFCHQYRIQLHIAGLTTIPVKGFLLLEGGGMGSTLRVDARGNLPASSTGINLVNLRLSLIAYAILRKPFVDRRWQNRK